jgi:hypothetical protein
MPIYFPVLRWKLGERGALTNLETTVKDQISPIIEFPPDCDYDDRKVADFCTNAINDWGAGRPFYLDLSAVNFDNVPTGIDHPAQELFRTAQQRNLEPIPIFNVNMDQELFVTIQQAYTDGLFRNLALRITENEEDTAADDAQEMMNDLGIDITDVDLIIDLRDVSNGAIQAKTRVLDTLVRQFGNDYHRSIVLSGAIPCIGDYVGTDANERIPRHDWRLWNHVHRLHNFEHLLFGDYTTIPCEFREVPYQGAPKIKYTIDDEWFVIKGHRARQRDNQRQTQALVIANAQFFRGDQYSFGENRIRQCADGVWGPGNSTNWVSNDINQHITFVVSQVPAILAGP